MKRLFTACAVGALFATTASAASLTANNFSSDNGQDGIMFDLEAIGGNGLNITAFDVNLDSGTHTIELYTKAGSHFGSENTPGDWNLLQTLNSVVSAGTDNPTPLDTTDFMIAAGQTVGVYLTATSGSPWNYNNGDNEFFDANLRIGDGTGKSYPFSSNFAPRHLSGTVYYDVKTNGGPPPSNVIPSPAAFGGGALGLLAILYSRRRRA